MMHDNMNPHVEPPKQETVAGREAPAADREVPISAANMPEIVHQWLDGERVDEAALQAAGGYALWSRLKAETDRRRRMHTPTPISGQIMEAIKRER
jgi:hypothetical protein